MIYWAYMMGTCIALNQECSIDNVVMDFSSKYTCEIHQTLITDIRNYELYQTHGNFEIYASYTECVDQSEIENLLEEW